MRTIYIDVLIVLNIYVDYFLLRITARVMHFPVRTRRCLLASAYASLFSLLILAPPMPVLLLNWIKLAASVTVILACFGRRGWRRLIVGTAVFYAANLVLAGAVFAVCSWLSPGMIHFVNGCFYIDLSLLVLVIVTAALYAAVCLARFLIDRSCADGGAYEVIIRQGRSVTVLSGLADSGNLLVDCFTGSPVIVCGSDKLGRVDMDKLPKGYRLLPCSTVSDSGMIPVFRPDEVLIRNTVSGERKRVEALIGLGSAPDGAVFNPRLLKV